MTTIYTIGHSRHSAEHFADLLRAQHVARLVDVRSRPVSRWARQFNKAALAAFLELQGIDYVFLGRELGGKPEGDAFYREDGEVDYARLAKSSLFAAGMGRLVALAGERTTAIVCAEEDPAACHRHFLITPRLRDAGFTVLHLRGDGRVDADVRQKVRTSGAKAR